MPRNETSLVGITTEWSQDSATGVLSQNAESTKSSPGGLTASPPVTGELAFGIPMVLACRVGIAANSPAAATTYRATLLNKSAPSKLKVLSVEARIVDLTTADFTDGDGGNLDLTVIRGDGAASEVESDILADFTLDDDYANGEHVRWPDTTTFLTNDGIVSGGSLYVDLVVDPDATAGATNDGATVDVWVTVLRVI